MNTTMNGAHPPPLCRACAWKFHDRCSGVADLPPDVPVTRCGCSCDRATGDRLIRGAIGWNDYEQRARQTRPAVAPPVSFTHDEMAELARLGEPEAEPVDDPPPAPPQWAARLAGAYYAIAVTGAVVGQAWGALTLIPWPTGWPVWLRVVLVLLPAACLETFGMAAAAMADVRQQLGERAYGFRVLSAGAATAAVGLIVAGHRTHPHLMLIFVTLSVSAYALWLLHSAARRRDALRAAGKLADTAPAYGLYRRVRHPIVTARAAELAREHGYDLYASLRAAELAIRAERRRPAIAAAVAELVRADHDDPHQAQIAVTTLDLDRIAAELADRADYGEWANRLAPAVMAYPMSTTPGDGDDNPAPDVTTNGGAGVDKRPRPVSTSGGTSTAERVAKVLAKKPDATPVEVAAKLGVSERTVQRNWPADTSAWTDNP